MRKIINILVFIPILIIGCNKSTKIQTINEDIEDAIVQILPEIQGAEIQEQEQKILNKVMYVNSLEGLRVRNIPSINGDRIGLLDNLTEVTVVKEDDGFVVIDGIYGKWVNIIAPIEGWIFDGFLENYEQHMERMDQIKNTFEKNIIGKWRVINASPISEEFELFLSLSGIMEFMDKRRSDRIYLGFEYDFEYGFFYGQWNWELGKNIIKIKGGWPKESESYGIKDFGEYYLTDVNFINNDNISLYDEIGPHYFVQIFSETEKLFLKLERIYD
jgi:hypothetical protein